MPCLQIFNDIYGVYESHHCHMPCTQVFIEDSYLSQKHAFSSSGQHCPFCHPYHIFSLTYKGLRFTRLLHISKWQHFIVKLSFLIRINCHSVMIMEGLFCSPPDLVRLPPLVHNTTNCHKLSQIATNCVMIMKRLSHQTSFDSHLLYTTPTNGLSLILNFESEVKIIMMISNNEPTENPLCRYLMIQIVICQLSMLIMNRNQVEEVVSEFSINTPTLLTRLLILVIIMIETLTILLNANDGDSAI